MGQCLQFYTIQGEAIDEQLLERRKVSDCYLVLEQLESLLEVSHGHVESSVGWVLAEDSLIGVGTG